MNEQDQRHLVVPTATHPSQPPREATSPPRRQPPPGATAWVAPHTRPGDQNSLCIETDQA